MIEKLDIFSNKNEQEDLLEARVKINLLVEEVNRLTAKVEEIMPITTQARQSAFPPPDVGDHCKLCGQSSLPT